MKVCKIQFAPWDKSYFFSYDSIDLKKDDLVVVSTEMGKEVGKVIGFDEVDEKKFCDKKSNCPKVLPIKPIDSIASYSDLKSVVSDKDKEEALDFAKSVKSKHKLSMKLVDVHFSYDGSKVTFAFIADGRVDFREMVKELTRHFSRNVRLQQIGIRDEVKVTGDCGVCGKTLCCRGHLTELASVTSEMAEVQQCAHRGSDRISGICGRLMCCLAYEEKGYSELSKKMPPIGKKVSVDGKRGEVVGHQVLKQAVNVKFTDENGRYTISEVDLNRNKKK